VLALVRQGRTLTGTLVTSGFVLVIVASFVCAAYLSYYGAIDVRYAFDYQGYVALAQRDAELLQNAEGEPKPTGVPFYRKLVDDDLKKMNGAAQTDAERAPAIGTLRSQEDFNRFFDALKERQDAGHERFLRALDNNESVRKASNALFALVALVALAFTFVQARLQRRIEEGRSVVERLQRAFLSRRKELPNVVVGTVLISATVGSEVGGDIYDVYAIDERYGAFLIADVSGKGVDAAVDTAFVKYSIRTLVGESRDPGGILSRFAALFARNIERPETFVVLFLGVIDTETGEVRYASAGHEPAWLRVGDDVHTIAPTGPIVGIMNDAEYETKVLRLSAGDAMLLSTDGLTESRDGRGRQLGAERVAEWFAGVDGSSQQMADAIVQRLRRRSRRIGDDLAILILRYLPKRGPDARPLRAGRARTLPQRGPERAE
jgi:serine phosphatase RsbU (regulator of sigma subunit)